MKKIFSAMVVAAALFAGYSAYNTQKEIKLTDVALANVEALADTNDKLDCGNVTFIPNEALRNVNCFGGLTGSKLKCKKHEGVCCDPSKQTTCDGLDINIGVNIK